MGLFSTKKNTTTQEIENRNSAIEDITGGVVISGSEKVQITDGGAFGSITETTNAALDANRRGLSDALDFGELSLLSVGSAFEQAGSQVQRVLETTTGGSPSSSSPVTRFDIQRDAVRFGALAIAVVVGFYVIRKR
jgi:hypothetical protein